MRSIDPKNDFETWRTAARSLLAGKIHPSEVTWEAAGLFDSIDAPPPSGDPPVKVPSAFVPFAREVSCHSDPARWSLLYHILWRMTDGGERHLLDIASDPAMARARTMAKNVRREIHKMHAFVRFKLISTDEVTNRERYAAWFEPDHHIVAMGTPFFRERFTSMDWSIFTPKGCAHWIGENFMLSPGIERNPIECPDALESAWSTYYRSIFNPARLKVKMMQTEMPKRYWKNLPEAAHIQDLITGSHRRVDSMLDRPPSPLRKAPWLPYLERLHELSQQPPITGLPPADASLAELKKLSSACRGCPLWERATCTVFGEGPENAGIMIVGEQPGDREDVAGRTFVGPAGKLLDQALAEAEVDRESAYVTNAVKHFKWTPRGKLRLHQKPDAAEIDACRPWLLGELKNIRPAILILLGSTAARSLLTGNISVIRSRGLVEATHLAPRVILTVHPSYLLRLPDTAKRDEEYLRFVKDLSLAR